MEWRKTSIELTQRLEERITPMQQALDRLITVQRNTCTNFFDEYKDVQPKEHERAMFVVYNLKDNATYADIVLDYALRLKKYIDEVDILVSMLLAEREGVVS